jgi:redox-sensing transcriptional repressor
MFAVLMTASCAPIDPEARSDSGKRLIGAGIAVPAAAAQPLADRLVSAGVKIIFNYSETLLQVPPEVTVHTSSPAVDLLYALYFYLT